MINVTGCEYQDNGATRIYRFSDASVVVERPELPGKSRYRCYDSRNRTIHDRSSCSAMKKSVDRFKKMRGIKS